MDSALPSKYEMEPWKQTKLKVMEYVDVIKNQLSTQLSKEQADVLILNLMDINENLGNVMLLPELLSLFFTNTSDIMLDYLYAEPKGFIAQEACYQIRNALLSILRGSVDEPKLNFSKLMTVLLDVIENDNEKCALTAYQILVEVIRKFPDRHYEDAKKTLSIFHKATSDFLKNVPKILDSSRPNSELDELDIKKLVDEVFISTQFVIQGNKAEFIPRGMHSLKFLSEIPQGSLVLNTTCFSKNTENIVWEILEMATEIISIHPTEEQRSNPHFYQESYVYFFQIQAKFTAFILHMCKEFEKYKRIEDQKRLDSFFKPEKIPQVFLGLLTNCPSHVPQTRKEIFQTMRSFIAYSSHRKYMAYQIELFIDDKVLFGNGWTSREALLSTTYSLFYDVINHLRYLLSVKQIVHILSHFSKNLFIYEPTLNISFHNQTIKFLVTLVEVYATNIEKEFQRQNISDKDGRILFLKIFAIITFKIENYVKYVIPAIVSKESPPSRCIQMTTLETLNASFHQSVSESASCSSDNNELNEQMNPSNLRLPNDGPLSFEDLNIKFGFPSYSVPTPVEARLFCKVTISQLKILAIRIKDISDKIEYAQNQQSLQSSYIQQQQAAQSSGSSNVPITFNAVFKNSIYRPKDLNLLIRLFKSGLKLLGAFHLHDQPQNTRFAASTSSSQKKEEQFCKDKANLSARGRLPSEKNFNFLNQTTAQRSKEEKDAIDSFSSIFASLPLQTFRAVLSESMEHFVNCINENISIQLVANHFFSLRATSYIFSNLLVEFLISKMEVMGENPELSNLYLRLFKIVFGSVQYHPNDNELMLKPHVSKIVNNSMNMALKAKEPYNYFQLLRALFRSIGGGSHDLLYQEFLPLLPTLLKGLNRLQSGIHVQSMKDLFVELCLTIPVRLSSLLPYLPWLMDPLVSALNGTQSLIAQGLRTLELCVDNLQPDFLYEHIQPIRTELMQALWKTLSHPVDSIASVSFRILGKLGGSNHKLMIEPQKLTWVDHGDSATQHFALSNDSPSQTAGATKPDHILPHNASSYVSIAFSEVMTNPPPQHSSTNSATIHLPIDKIIETASKVLRDPASDKFYVFQSWEIIKGFLASHVQTLTSEEDALKFQQLFITSSLTTGDFPPHSTEFSSVSNGISLDQSSLYMFPDEKQRKIHELALISMVIASSIKGSQHTKIVRFMVPLVRHYTMLVICQQAAGLCSGLTYTTATLKGNGSTSVPKFAGMDPLVLVDALAAVIGQEANGLCKAGCMMFRIIWETTISFLGSKERASQLPLYEYILDRICALSYKRPWYSKYGGCYALKHFLLKHMSLRWIFNHAFKILKAMLFVIMDLSDDLSLGVIELAKNNLNVLIKTCASSIVSTLKQRELADVQKKTLSVVIQEMLRSTASPHTLVREEAMHLLQVLAQTTEKTVTEIATPHKGILEEMICTRKIKLFQLPPNIQIGILDCNAFCTTLEPPLFAIDIKNPDHMNFFNEVQGIAETNDAQLQKQSCYKGLESLVPLKKSCLKVLAAWHHIPAFRPKIFSALYMALDSSDIELQECAFQCFDKYKNLKEVDPDIIRSGIRNLIKNISDFRTLTPSSIIRLRYFARLFTYIFNDKFCEQFLKHLYQLTEVVCQHIRKGKERDFKIKFQAASQQNNGGLTSQQTYELNSKLNQLDVNFQHSVCIEIINLFAEMTTADSSYVEHLMKFLIKSENLLDNYAAFKFYEPMRRFLLRYPQATVTFALNHLLEHGVFRILKYLITGENGAPFRTAMYQHSFKTIVTLLRTHAGSLDTTKTEDRNMAEVSSPTGSTSSSGSVTASATANTIERFHLLSIIKVLLKYDENWLFSQPELFHILRSIWLSDSFFQDHSTPLSTFEYWQFKEPKVLAKCLLAHFNANKDSEIDTLFILLRTFIMKHNSDTEFFRKYLSETIMKTQSVEWKRAAFFRFVEIFREEIDHGTSLWTQDMITNILKFVIIPAFAYSFECGKTERLLGPPSMKAQMFSQGNQENPDLVYIFVSKVYAEIKHYSSDSVRIVLMQFMYLVIDHATAYVQPNNSKRQEKQTQKNTEDNSMRLIMSYPWSTLSEHCIDPGNKYFGHLLMALLITRMPLAKSITRSMYLSLMKPTSSEAKQLVRASFDLMINHIAQNQKHEHFKKMLPKWFRQTFIDESCNQQHLIHLMQVISRHHRLFYANRHQFIPSMLNVIKRIGLISQATIEIRQIALDLLEVIIRWEVYRKQETSEHAFIENALGNRVGQVVLTPIGHKRSFDKMESDSPMGAASELSGTPKKELLSKVASGPILKEQAEMIMNILIRFPIVIADPNTSTMITTNTNAIYDSQASSAPSFSTDYLVKRAQELIKIVFQTDIWPNLDIRNSYIDRALSSKEINLINAALDLLSIFLQTMRKEMMLKVFISLQKYIYNVCQNTHPHVSRSIYNLLCKLMSIFPPSCSNLTILPKSGATVKIYQDQLEPLEQLYTDIHSLILTGFNAYEKAIIPQTQSYIGTETTSTLSSLSATLNILKAACFNQPSYIDRLLTPFLNMFSKLVKEQQLFSNVPRTQASQAEQFASSKLAELIVTSLELVKNRVGAFNSEMRRNFMNIFQNLIEKTTDAKVMKTLVKIFEDWLKNQPSSQGRSSGAHPGIAFRDKTSFLTKIASGIEQRRELSEDAELRTMFLDLIYYIYSESSHKAPDLATKIEASFMKGLCSSQPLIRQKFFGLLNTHIRKRLYDRLMYICCEQNWETIGSYYWIGQCIELLLSVSDSDASLKSPNVFAKLPLPTSFLATVTGQFSDKYSCPITGSISALGIDSLTTTNEDVVDYDFIGTPSGHLQDRSAGPTDIDMTEFSVDNSETDAKDDSSPLMDSQSGHSAAANSFYNDLFGIQTSSSAAHLRALNRDRSGSFGFNSYGLTSVTAGTQPVENKVQQLTQVCSFLRHLDQLKSSTFINAVVHLCHFDTSLAHHIWIQLFPRAYAVLHEKMQLTIALQMAPFFISGAHVLSQLSRDPAKSPLHTFYEATTFCKPTINLRPSIMKYIGKNHNIWHRVVLTLEETLEKFDSKIHSVGVGGLLANGSNAYNGQLAAPKTTRGSNSNAGQDGNMSASTPNHLENFPELPSHGITYSQECAIALNQVYELLREEDYWAGIWQQEATFDQTKIAIALEQMGFFEEAKSTYELAMSKARDDYSWTNPAYHLLKDEYILWEQHWIRCSKELNQWDFLLEYANATDCKNNHIIMESAWRIPDWDQMYDAIMAVEQNTPKVHSWKVPFYKGYNYICSTKHRELDQVQKCVDSASRILIQEWRRLPPLVSTVHVDYLHAAHQVMELNEAGQLHLAVFNGNVPPPSGSIGPSGHERTAPVDLRSVIKTWKNRLPVISDDLSHWSDIFTWRQHHYQILLQRYEGESARLGSSAASQNSLVGSHASAQSLIHYAKIARKHSLTSVCLDSLNRIHTIPRVPIVDCFQKIRQQLKCYLFMHQTKLTPDDLQEGLKVIESTHLRFFQREMISEFYALRGQFLAKAGQREEANRTFSVAIQIMDTIISPWAAWGEYYDELFSETLYEKRNLSLCSAAIIAYLHACRLQNEVKARKYLSKVFWFISYDDETHTLAKVVDKYNHGVPVFNWLPWVSQLLTCLCRSEGDYMGNLVQSVSKIYPQAMYYPARTIFLSFQLENREIKNKKMLLSNLYCQIFDDANNASPKMVLFSKLMHNQLENSPMVTNTLENIAEELSFLRENWYEAIYRNLQLCLAKCYTSAFESSKSNQPAEPLTPPHLLSFLHKLISNLDNNIEFSQSQSKITYGDDGTAIKKGNANINEIANRRVQFKDSQMFDFKRKFAKDFEISQSNKKLQFLISRIKKWIKLLDKQMSMSTKTYLLEEKSRYLAQFSRKMIAIALPGEFLLPKLDCISIAKFMPFVETVPKHNCFARRLNIRGQNGKIYPYLVINEFSIFDLRREERFLQLQRLFNLYLLKHKETARRLLNFTVPKVVPYAHSSRLIEDNTTSLSLQDIYKKYAIQKGFELDAPIAKYYEELAKQKKVIHSTESADLQKILSDVQANLVPKTVLKEWAVKTFNSAPDFWHFRKQFILQLGLINFSEYVFILNPINPDMIYIHRDSGLITPTFPRFDIFDDSGELLTSHNLVPFRITHNLQNFITKIGIQGPLTATITSAAICFSHPNYKVRNLLFAILRDEFIYWSRRVKSSELNNKLNTLIMHAQSSLQNKQSPDSADKHSSPAAINSIFQINPDIKALIAKEVKEITNEEVVNLAKKAEHLMVARLSSFSTIDIHNAADSKVTQQIGYAISPDSLARMDPAWHPWL